MPETAVRTCQGLSGLECWWTQPHLDLIPQPPSEGIGEMWGKCPGQLCLWPGLALPHRSRGSVTARFTAMPSAHGLGRPQASGCPSSWPGCLAGQEQTLPGLMPFLGLPDAGLCLLHFPPHPSAPSQD